MNQRLTWKQINHPDIQPGYLVSPQGYIKAKGVDDDKCIKEPSYRATNGYDFVLLYNKDLKLQLFPIDDIVAMAYIPIPSSLKNKPIKVSHINGDTRDISLINLQWVEDVEEWRDIGELGYDKGLWFISSYGRVYGTRYHKILKQRVGTKYSYYSIGGLRIKDTHGITRFTHKLVAEMFVKNPNPQKFKIVNHIDGNKLHNFPKNLEWVDLKQNAEHAILTDLTTFKYGSENHSAKLSESDVNKICELLLKYDGNIDKVSNVLKINKYAIRAIRNGQAWLHISKDYFSYRYFIKKKKPVSPEIARKICLALIDNKMDITKTKDSLKEYNIPLNLIKDIKRKKSYKNISKDYF